MIRVQFNIDDIREYQRGKLPENAFKIKTPGSVDEMLKMASPIAAVLCAVLIATMFLKTMGSGMRVVNFMAVFGGFIIGLALLAVHEWLHAIVYPKTAEVTIGKIKGKFVFVALASWPMGRSRFILMSLLPFVLGIVPLAVFILSPAGNTIWNGFMFGMASMGMVSPYADVYNVISVLRHTKKNDKVMFYEDDLYRISE